MPSLVTDQGDVLTQSVAILEWLDETHPTPAILPRDPAGRARVRSLALAIACDIHPLDNLRVLNYLTGTLGVTEAQKNGWYKYWIDVGFEALETRLARERATGHFCHGDAPTIADICLVPQMANARRVDFDFTPYPTLTRIEAACQALPAFAARSPGEAAGRGVAGRPDDLCIACRWELPGVPIHGSAERFPVRHIYCVGRNYAEHAKEMGGDAAKEPPFFFTKAADSIVPVVPPAVGRIAYPLATKNLHHEIELVVAIGGRGVNLAPERARRSSSATRSDST